VSAFPGNANTRHSSATVAALPRVPVCVEAPGV
jgi:hypothetical protein